jgi:FkbM family methyltransferase
VREINRLTQTRYGRFLYNPNDVYIGKALEAYGEAHEFELELLRQLSAPGSTIFDLGANIGDHTIPLAKHVGASGFVYAFEPQRPIFQVLNANVALNDLPNVDCVHAALGSTHGSVLIPEIDYSVEANYGGIAVSEFKEGRPVERIMLDDYLDVHAADLVKVDVEGMEAEVLEGGRKFLARFRPVMYVENDRIDRSHELIELLYALNYRAFWHVTPLYNPANFKQNAENLYPNIVTTNMLCIPKELPFETQGPSFSEVLDPSEHPFKDG